MAVSDAVTPVIPDEIGYVYGWRAWKWDAAAQCLRPYMKFPHMEFPVEGEKVADAWVGKQAHARCGIMHAVMAAEPHTIDLAGWSYHPLTPDPRCLCGLYGTKDPGQAMGVFNLGYGWIPLNQDVVFGRVRQWGRVIEYEEGYRSEFAEVIEIVHDGTSKIPAIAQKYEADVISPPETKKAMIALWASLLLLVLAMWLTAIALNALEFLREPNPLNVLLVALLVCVMYWHAKSEYIIQPLKILLRRGKKKT